MNNERAIEILKNYVGCYLGHLSDEEFVALELAIKALERPQGEWIIDGHHIRCNKCNEYICNADREGNKIPDNFCPNCGADMRGEE